MCAFGKECHKHGCRFPHDEDEATEWKNTHIAKWELSQKLSKLPRKGYVCRSCGKEGGCEDSHWVRDCPRKQKRSAPTAGICLPVLRAKGWGEGGALDSAVPKVEAVTIEVAAEVEAVSEEAEGEAVTEEVEGEEVSEEARSVKGTFAGQQGGLGEGVK